MEQPFSSSKVTVEYYDPYGVYKLIAPGLVPRLPLRHLHWQSHAGPLRSIDTLHIELLSSDADPALVASPTPAPATLSRRDSNQPGQVKDDGQTASSTGRESESFSTPQPGGGQRRHQIPGLRRTPYLKVLLVRCDDNDSYKSTVRSEVREWIKKNSPPTQSTKKGSTADNHDAFEWMILHVVIPNTTAATQPRISGRSADGSMPDLTKTSSRWGKSSTTILEKLRADFNGSSKAVDRVAQIRIGINDVPYDLLPRVVPAVPTGYTESARDAEVAWEELIDKLKMLILTSFDLRVSQYEEDIKERDAQRSLPGWNFCTFFILKEGLAQGFESVGLVEDALVGYDELSVGLDTILQEQAAAGNAEAHGGALLKYTEDLKMLAQSALSSLAKVKGENDGEPATTDGGQGDAFQDISISSSKKPYRDLILANNVSVFDFRCYIFARQIALLLRLANAWSTREELLAKLKEQQESVLHGVAPRAPPPKHTEESENLSMLAEICRRTLEFIPAVSLVMRSDVVAALTKAPATDDEGAKSPAALDPVLAEVVDNMVASYAFSIAQQILAQTSTKALPIPATGIATADGQEQKASIPEPKTIMHPARNSSLGMPPAAGRPPPSPGIFPGPNSRPDDSHAAHFLKVGLEELAARRAELYTLSRNILNQNGKKRGWDDGWQAAPILGEAEEMEDIDLDGPTPEPTAKSSTGKPSIAGFENALLKTALDNKDDFYRLYETLTDKALRHFTVANHRHSVQGNVADLAVLKYHLRDFSAAADYFYQTTPFFGESGWTLLELSMLIMYSSCLKELKRKDDYVRVVLKLLTKAATAEKERKDRRTSLRVGRQEQQQLPDQDAIRGFLPDLLEMASQVQNEVRLSLTSFFDNVEVDGSPIYDDEADSFSIKLRLSSLLIDDFSLESAKIRIVGQIAGQPREIWLESKGSVTIRPGKGSLQLHSNTIVAGQYEVDQVRFASGKLSLYFDRDPATANLNKATTILRHPHVTLYQRARGLDVDLSVAKHIQLDKTNALDLELTSGWNDILSCEIRVRAATGGLRLLTSEAKVVESNQEMAKPPEAGVITLQSIPPEDSVKIRIPFTVEQDVHSVSMRIEVQYTTSGGTFTFAKTPNVPIGLCLGVNVQDVFKHTALFSRFTVSTATSSPLRLFKSELQESEAFEPHFGVPPSNPLVIFPKQPASLLYKITRKPNVTIGPKTQKTMYLNLFYSVVQDEIEALLRDSLQNAMHETPFAQFSRLVTSNILAHLRTSLSSLDLERAALLQYLPTSFLASVNWAKQFPGLGRAPDGTDTATNLAALITDWQKTTPRIPLQHSHSATPDPRSILIPVDIPPITVVHTADIRIPPVPSLPGLDHKTTVGGPPTVCVNQLLSAILHLKWTRIWDTAIPGSDSEAPTGTTEDLEFSFDVSAPTDAWLLAGRRKGHFVIPAPNLATGEGLTSTAGTEAEIPLLLVPLREGYLPYPMVDIREVGGEGGEGQHPCETDYRNLGETVRAVVDRRVVTVSLDASGPGGGPLVLECEGGVVRGRVVV